MTTETANAYIAAAKAAEALFDAAADLNPHIATDRTTDFGDDGAVVSVAV